MRIWYNEEYNDGRIRERVVCTSCHRKVRITKKGFYYRHKILRRAHRPYAHNPDCFNSGRKVENL